MYAYSSHCTVYFFIMTTNKKYTKLKYDGFESHLKIEERLLDGWRWKFDLKKDGFD